LSHWTPLSPSVYNDLAMGKAYGLTDVGVVRVSNEDNFLIDKSLSLIMIADGMGGHEAGEVASKEVLLAVRDFIQNATCLEQNENGTPLKFVSLHDAAFPEIGTGKSDSMPPAIKTMFDAVEFANSLLYSQNLTNNNGEGHGMGTTLTGLWQSEKNGQFVVFHVGDSRLYRFRNDELCQLTRDQTLYQQALEDGLIDNLPPRNMLLQAMGPYDSIQPEIHFQSIQAGDIYMLCTDGLYGSVSNEMIVEILRKTSSLNLEPACQELISLAKTLGSRDNVTAILIAC
jgi:serine/threonine protein phosphatase PrpC